MIGGPKQGKTTLAREIGLRLLGKLWVIDHEWGGVGRGWLGGLDERAMADLLRDHFANGGCDVLLVMRSSRSWFNDPLASFGEPALFGMADWVFGVEMLNASYGGWTWYCSTIRDRQGVYNPDWIWDARQPNHEFWVQHVKPFLLNAHAAGMPDSLAYPGARFGT